MKFILSIIRALSFCLVSHEILNTSAAFLRIQPRIHDYDATPQAFRLNKRKVNLVRFIILYDRASSSNDVDYAFGPLGYNFSSKSGWDRFYEQDDENSVFEWHSDVKNEDAVEECLLYVNLAYFDE